MANRQLTKQELKDIQWILEGTVPENPPFEFFVKNRMILLLSDIAKYLGLNAFVIRRYAKAKAGRFEEMGITMIGKKFHANCRIFADWALTHRPTRRRMMLHFLEDLSEPPPGGDLKQLLQSGKMYLYDDLSSAQLIPSPFSTDGGKETLLEEARHLQDPKTELGLFKHPTFEDWIVDPEPFFAYLGQKYFLVE